MTERTKTPEVEDTSTDSGNGPLTLRDRVQSLRLSGQAEASGGHVWLPWTLCALLALSTTALAVRSTWSPARPEADKSAKVEDTVAASGDVVLEAKGYIIPAHQIQVSPKVGGMVEKLYIEEGKQVQKGDILAELEKINYQATANRAKGTLEAARERLRELENGSRPEEIESAKAALAEAEAQRDQLYLDWKRTSNLKKGNALAERDYEQADSAFKAMDRRVQKLRSDYDLMVKGPREERIAVARAEIRQAEADLVTAQWNLDNCTVRAPVSGTILTKKAEEGNIVNPIAFNVSASLCDMADLSDLEVDLTIQERDIAAVFVGQRCQIRPEAFSQRVYEGAVSRLMPIADRAKGAIPVRVKLTVPKEEEGVYLKPEMGVIVSFLKK